MVFVLSLIPCQEDALNNNRDHAVIIHKASTPANTADACSPFCTCSCCTTPTVALMQVYSFHNIPVTCAVAYSDHLPGKLLRTHLSIWQPPQLS
ncbi:hypothetical protein [Mucilaginibacter sp. 14171R-50]|uniref:hypothetical protein n=1 Tax=Mucilaginibacter sp. 14171R-50 TaxID=2703789 RepID=UPI00351A5A62